jgi:hypothetical protein
MIALLKSFARSSSNLWALRIFYYIFSFLLGLCRESNDNAGTMYRYVQLLRCKRYERLRKISLIALVVLTIHDLFGECSNYEFKYVHFSYFRWFLT